MICSLGSKRDLSTCFGGHRAAAGCTVAASSVEAFAASFEKYCAAIFADQPVGAVDHADAVVGGDGLSIELAEQLNRLGPFGIGNPKPRLMIPGARLDGARTMGEGKHLRCTVNSAGLRIGAVAFGTARLPDGADTALDVVGSLEVNRWRGAEELRFVIGQTAVPAGVIELAGRPDDDLDALREALAGRPLAGAAAAEEGSRELLDRRGCGVAGVLGEVELASFDGSKLELLAEAPDRRELEASSAFRENARAAEEAREWLSPIASLAA